METWITHGEELQPAGRTVTAAPSALCQLAWICWFGMAMLQITMAGAWACPWAAEQGASEQQPPVSDADLERWIGQLAADDYHLRERAADRLLHAGAAAEPLLREAAASPVLETQLQAKRILAMVLEVEMEKRIEAFVNDIDGSQGIALPGWVRVRDRLQLDESFRPAFVQLYRSEPVLFATYGKSVEDTGPMLVQRITTLRQSLQEGAAQRLGYHYRNQVGSLRSNVLAILLIGTDPEIELDKTNMALCDQFIQQIVPPGQSCKLVSAIQIQKWIGEWITHQSSDPLLDYQRMLMGMKYGSEKAILLAERILKAENSQARQQMYAALCIAQFGDRGHLAVIESLLDKEHMVHSSIMRIKGKRIQRTIQLRDIALAVAIRMTDQEHAAYGLKHVVERPPYVFQPQSIYFEEPADRDQALAQWRAWRSAHP